MHGCQHLLAADQEHACPNDEEIESALRRELQIGWIGAERLREDLREWREEQPDRPGDTRAERPNDERERRPDGVLAE